MSFVRKREYAIVTAILVFLVLYAIGINCEDEAYPEEPYPEDDPVVFTPNVQPYPGQYPVNPVTVQPYPVAYPQPYPYPYPYPQPGGVVTLRDRYILPSPGHRNWTKPRYVRGQPIRNGLRFLFIPRWSSKGGGCNVGCNDC